jgi:predicted transcriptional regulator
MPLINDKAIGMRLPSALHRRLQELALAEHRTLSNYIVHVLSEHVAQVERESSRANKGKK